MEIIFPVKRVGGNANGSGSRLMWNKEQINFVLSHYKVHHNVKELSKICGVSQETMRRVLNKNGVKIFLTCEKGKKDRPRNSDYFESIACPEKAYWLGFLYADGYNSESRKSIRINLQEKDAMHLQKFLNAIDATNHKICYQNKNMGEKTFKIAYVAITDKKMSEDLARKGCVQKKSLILKFPDENQVPANLLSHFIRGYFDGDGSIYCLRVKKDNKLRFGMSITGTHDFLVGTQMFLEKTNVKLECRGKFYCLHICGSKQIYNSLSLLYENSEAHMEMTRKREKYEMLVLQRIGGEPVNTGCA